MLSGFFIHSECVCSPVFDEQTQASESYPTFWGGLPGRSDG